MPKQGAVRKKEVEATKSIRKKILSFRSGVSVGEKTFFFQETFKPSSSHQTEIVGVFKAEEIESKVQEISLKSKPIVKQIAHNAKLMVDQNHLYRKT